MGQALPVDDFVRVRVRELLHQHGWSHTRLCKRLTEITGEPWLLQRFGKLMNGHIRLKVEDLVWISRATGLSLVEMVREPGREYVADLTPTELRLIEHIRARPDFTPHLLALIGPLEKRKGSRRLIRDRMRRDRAEP